MENINVVLLSKTEDNLDEIILYYKENKKIELSKSLKVFDAKSFINFFSLDLVILDNSFISKRMNYDSLKYEHSKNVIVIQILDDATIKGLYNSSILPKYYLSEKLLNKEILTEAICDAVRDSVIVN